MRRLWHRGVLQQGVSEEGLEDVTQVRPLPLSRSPLMADGIFHLGPPRTSCRSKRTGARGPDGDAVEGSGFSSRMALFDTLSKWMRVHESTLMLMANTAASIYGINVNYSNPAPASSSSHYVLTTTTDPSMGTPHQDSSS